LPPPTWHRRDGRGGELTDATVDRNRDLLGLLTLLLLLRPIDLDEEGMRERAAM
jgi:hypothetical protein